MEALDDFLSVPRATGGAAEVYHLKVSGRSNWHKLDAAIAKTNTRMPDISVTGLFGAGWDDVSWESDAIVDTVVAYNAAATGHIHVRRNQDDAIQANAVAGQQVQ